MTWHEDLRRVDFNGKKLVGASFRGAPFFVEMAGLDTGRRTVTHEFPGRDDPFVEDMGRRARKFRVDGYVIGDDYLDRKNALLDALEAEGPGTLVHPYYGIRRGIGDTVSVTEQRADAGWAQFTIDFVETPLQAPVPTVDVDSASQVATSADATQAAVQTQFVADFDPIGLASFALGSASTAIAKASAALAAKLAPIVTDTQELATLNSQLTVITAQASALARQPFVVLAKFLDAISGLANTAAAAPGALKDALVAAYEVDLGALVTATTATRTREFANQLAITGGLRQVMAVEAARLAPVVAYASLDDATAARDQVAGLLEDQAATAGDVAFPLLVTLRSDVLRAVPGIHVFPRVVTIERRTAIPSLLLAYQLYGSVSQEADVVARNRVRHPGFISGSLQVLSDGG